MKCFWGFLLYRYVKSVIVPILYRYPGQEVPTGRPYLDRRRVSAGQSQIWLAIYMDLGLLTACSLAADAAY